MPLPPCDARSCVLAPLCAHANNLDQKYLGLDSFKPDTHFTKYALLGYVRSKLGALILSNYIPHGHRVRGLNYDSAFNVGTKHNLFARFMSKLLQDSGFSGESHYMRFMATNFSKYARKTLPGRHYLSIMHLVPFVFGNTTCEIFLNDKPNVANHGDVK